MADEQSQSYVSPLFFVGIIIFILPVVVGFVKFHMPSFTYGVGIGFIVVGIIHTIIRRR